MKGRVFNYTFLIYLGFITKIGKSIIDPNLFEGGGTQVWVVAIRNLI
jgi:hypothetical protein